MKKFVLILSIVVSLFLSGCGVNRVVVSQNFSARIPEINKIGVILSDVSVQEISVDGGKAFMAPETTMAIPIVEKVAIESAKGLRAAPKLLTLNKDTLKVTVPFNKFSVEELYRLLTARNSEPIMEEFGKLAKKTGVDAFLLFRSCENESSGGLKTLKVLTVLSGGIAFGEKTFADISLVDKKGHLLYYNHALSSNTLRDMGDVKNIFNELMEDLYKERAKI